MTNKVQIDQLADAITKELHEYTEEVSAGIAEVVDQIAKECKAEIVANSPKRTGKYAKGWTIKKDNGYYRTKRIIWNKNYRLPHLLEKGHAKRGGGRVAGIPHIKPAEEKYSAKLIKCIEDVIRSSGK